MPTTARPGAPLPPLTEDVAPFTVDVPRTLAKIVPLAPLRPLAEDVAPFTVDVPRTLAKIVPLLPADKRDALRSLVSRLTSLKQANAIPSVAQALAEQTPAVIGEYWWRQACECQRPPPSRTPVITPQRPSDWLVGAHVRDADDSTVRGIVTDIPNMKFREVATTTGPMVMLRFGQLRRTTLTDEEAARCIRPASKKDYIQARIDSAIRFSYDGRGFVNRYMCADGTERREFEVTATHVRCAL